MNRCEIRFHSLLVWERDQRVEIAGKRRYFRAFERGPQGMRPAAEKSLDFRYEKMYNTLIIAMGERIMDRLNYFYLNIIAFSVFSLAYLASMAF